LLAPPLELPELVGALQEASVSLGEQGIVGEQKQATLLFGFVGGHPEPAQHVVPGKALVEQSEIRLELFANALPEAHSQPP